MRLVGDRGSPSFGPQASFLRTANGGTWASVEFHRKVATSLASSHAQTLRWAIIDKLRNPPPGFEEVVTAHFKALRHKVGGGWAWERGCG